VGFNGFLDLFSVDIGIDLGTCNTLVYLKGKGIILSEPSVVAVRKGTNRVLANGQAVGNVAKEMLGKTPARIAAIRPLKDGVISDFDIAEAMIKYFIQKAIQGRKWVKPRAAISHPSGITAVEKRAVIVSAERAGARKIYLIPEPIAAGIGVGMSMSEPVGNMIVDIGGGTTEVAVLSLGDIVASKSSRVAGDEMDEAIIQHIKDRHNLLTGEQSAERVKIEIGSAFPLEQEMTMIVKGTDVITRIPRQITVSSEEIRDALKEPVSAIIRTVHETLEDTPAELAADLVDKGIILAGGGALLKNIDKAIQSQVGIPVKIADEPLKAVAMGTGAILENLDKVKDRLESAEDLL
jgi:rod shape-determining protein MreB